MEQSVYQSLLHNEITFIYLSAVQIKYLPVALFFECNKENKGSENFY